MPHRYRPWPRRRRADRRPGRTGRPVIGIEPDPSARAAAASLIAAAGVDNVDVRPGTATDTGIPAGSVDVAMLRHVLAHNGPDEQRIVDHLATLVRPGGSVYLLDVDGTAVRILDVDPVLEDLEEKYRELHRRRGNDLQVGLRLGKLLTRAGLDVVLDEGRYVIAAFPPGLRPPAWAPRETMVAQGIATEDDVRRWAAAFAPNGRRRRPADRLRAVLRRDRHSAVAQPDVARRAAQADPRTFAGHRRYW